MIKSMASNHKLVLLVLILSIGAVGLIGLFFPILALGIASLLCLLVWLLRTAWMPAGYGANKVRMLSLTLSFALAGTYGFWAEGLNTLIKTAAQQPDIANKFPWLNQIHLDQEPSVLVLVFFLLVIFVVNRYMADRSIAGTHPKALVEDFPEVSFAEQFKSFCRALQQHLDHTDLETQWHPGRYAELEAEVEIIKFNTTREHRRIINLQQAMRSHRRIRCFLLLGDPGSGKSVALRKLARDMLAEAGDTGRVPIYINLREWLPRYGRLAGAWTQDNPPILDDIESFVTANLKSRGDKFTADFVDAYFHKLWQHGRLFFLFDSFDEIPELLDANEASWLLDALSNLLHRFIATHVNSRGVLASRVFRRPTQAYMAEKILEIRPLSEHRIETALRRFPAFTPELRTKLFRERHDLVPSVRNPFIMTLLGEWVEENRCLPENQAQLYDGNLRRSLARCQSQMQQHGLTADEVMKGATAIATYIFNEPEYGLEAPVQVIGDRIGIAQAPVILEILSQAKLARVTRGETPSFAFAHRRFLEFLVTADLLEKPEKLPEDHIPTDARGREAMVLYAQVCRLDEATRIASSCWEEVKTHFQGKPTEQLRAIHCLRFLIDAFRTRQDATRRFEGEYSKFIAENVCIGQSIITAKICLEGTGLLPEEEAPAVLQTAMESGDEWLQETAFRACRSMPRVHEKLRRSIKSYLLSMPLMHFWKEYKAISFSLSLSDSLSKVRAAVQWRYINSLTWALAIPLMLLANPLIFLSAAVLGAFLRRDALMQPHNLSHQVVSLAQTSFLAIYLVIYFFVPAIFIHNYLLISLLILSAPWHTLLCHHAEIIEKLVNQARKFLYPNLQALYNWGRLTKKAITAALEFIAGLIILAIIFIPLALVANKFGGKDGLELLTIAIGALLLIGYLFFVIKKIWIILRNDKKDRNFIRSQPISPRLSRRDIAYAMRVLVTKRRRLQFIQRLAQERVQATGEWPEDFQLAVGQDAAITELARLEERWLNLDR